MTECCGRRLAPGEHCDACGKTAGFPSEQLVIDEAERILNRCGRLNRHDVPERVWKAAMTIARYAEEQT